MDTNKVQELLKDMQELNTKIKKLDMQWKYERLRDSLTTISTNIAIMQSII